MNATSTTEQAVLTYEDLAPFVGKRVRLGYPHGTSKGGMLTAHPLRNAPEVVDYRIDGRGGFLYGYEATLQVMGRNGRYRTVWSATWPQGANADLADHYARFES